MSVIDISRYAAYPQYQVGNVVINPPDPFGDAPNMALGQAFVPTDPAQPLAMATDSLYPVLPTQAFRCASMPAVTQLQMNPPLALRYPQFQTAIASDVSPACAHMYSQNGVFFPNSYWAPGTRGVYP